MCLSGNSWFGKECSTVTEKRLSPIGEIILAFIDFSFSMTDSLVVLVFEGVRNWFKALNKMVSDI